MNQYPLLVRNVVLPPFHPLPQRVPEKGDAFLGLPYFDHMHRFLPALLLRNGVKLAHVQVSHRARVHGTSKYGFWNRALVGATDLMGAAWLARRRLPEDYGPTEVKANTQ